MRGDLENDVKRFVAEQLAVRFERLTPATRLQHDLGVDGADGWEFMAAFAERFGVGIGEFRADLHFGPEAGCNPLGYLPLLVCRLDSVRLVPITVADLVEAARSGRWRTLERDRA